MFERMGLLMILLAALSGCEKGAPEGARPGGGRVTLRLWHIYGGGEGAKNVRERAVLDAAVKRFEAAHPRVKVKVETFANDDFKSKLAVEINSGTPPDVFFTWGGGPLAELASAGRVVDLTDALAEGGWRDRVLPAPLSFCTVKGRVYAVPLDISCVPLWYNAELFSKYGLKPPRTFEELLAVSRALRAKGVTPLALGNMKQWPGAFYFIYLASRCGGTQLFFDAAARKPGRRFDDPAFVRAGELLQELVKAGAFSKGFNGMIHDQARTQFFDGRAAMYLMGTWLVAKAREAPEFFEKMKCVAFPLVREGKGDPTTVVGGVNCAFAVSSACKERKAAVELVLSLTDEKTAAAWCEIGRIPAIRVPEEVLVKLPGPTRSALGMLRRAKFLQPYYDQYLPSRLAKEHKDTTTELLAETLTPRDAAERMERRAEGG